MIINYNNKNGNQTVSHYCGVTIFPNLNLMCKITVLHTPFTVRYICLDKI